MRFSQEGFGTANGRIAREKISIERMIEIYCKDKHGSGSKLCNDCEDLLQYALQRLTRCKFGESKPICAKCPIHCYHKDMRERIITVMRYAGPRMLLRHPILAVYHIMDSLKK